MRCYGCAIYKRQDQRQHDDMCSPEEVRGDSQIKSKKKKSKNGTKMPTLYLLFSFLSYVHFKNMLLNQNIPM